MRNEPKMSEQVGVREDPSGAWTEAARRALRRHAPRTVNAAFDTCKRRSFALAKAWAEQGMEVEVRQLVGYKGDTSRMHPRWKRVATGVIVHYVVREGNWYVDTTFAQFSGEHGVRILTPREVEALWESEFRVPKESWWP